MRTIPPLLAAAMQKPVTTTCRLLKFNLTNGQQFGMAALDRDETYDGLTYSAINGFDASTMASDAGLSVDNGEGYILLAADIPGITEEMVAAGYMDDAEWEMLLIDYEHPEYGHVVLDAGDVGEVRVNDDAVFMPELLSYAMRLRQGLGHVSSRACRAIFGTPANSQTGCGVDADALWVSLAVDAVGVENEIQFTVASMPAGYYPGRLVWTSGSNTSSKKYQIESVTGDYVTLLEPVPFPILPGDTFDIRPDCAKTPDACKAHGNYPNGYKGEPLIPVADGLEMQTPKRVSAGSSGGK